MLRRAPRSPLSSSSAASDVYKRQPVDCSKLEKPWTVWLKDIVPEYEIVSDGVCGRATTHYLENEDKTNGLKDFRERYLSGENDFDLIIIMLGTNDVLNNIDFSNQKTADVLKIYVEECRAKFGKDKPKILLVSPVSYTHLRAHETDSYLVCRLLLEKKKPSQRD